MSTSQLTLDDIWQLFKETDRKFQETNLKFHETNLKFQDSRMVFPKNKSEKVAQFC